MISDHDRATLDDVGGRSPKRLRRPKAGRPRRLTLDAILDAANDIGPDLDMKAIADALGVGVGTLYGYVDGRDDLVKLVAGRHARYEPVRDTGQPWQEAVLSLTDTIFRSYVTNPSLVTHIMNCDVGPAAEVRHLDAFLAILLDRGFSPADSIALYGEVIVIAVGAAVLTSNMQAAGGKRGSFATSLRFLLDRRGEHELGALRRCAELRIDMPDFKGYLPALNRLCAEFESRCVKGR
jgi:AcrR family transcriptional regulator